VITGFLIAFSGSTQAHPAAGGFRIQWSQLTFDAVDAVDWSPDGRYIALGNSTVDELQIQVFDWSSQTIMWSRSFAALTNSQLTVAHPLRWSPDRRYLATISGGELFIVDFQTQSLLENRDVLARPRDRSLDKTDEDFLSRWTYLDWGTGSDQIALLDMDGYMDIASIPSGDILQTIDISPDPNMRGEGIGYINFDWSPNGLLIAVPHYIPGIPLRATMGFWDQNGNLLTAYETPNDDPGNQLCPVYGTFLYEVQSVKWANDSRTLAVGGSYGYGTCTLTVDGTIENKALLEAISMPLGTLPAISHVSWSPDQQWLVAVPVNDPSCAIRISHPIPDATVSEVVISSEDCFVNSLSWSPDSQYVAAGTSVGLWVGRLGAS